MKVRYETRGASRHEEHTESSLKNSQKKTYRTVLCARSSLSWDESHPGKLVYLPLPYWLYWCCVIDWNCGCESGTAFLGNRPWKETDEALGPSKNIYKATGRRVRLGVDNDEYKPAVDISKRGSPNETRVDKVPCWWWRWRRKDGKAEIPHPTQRQGKTEIKPDWAPMEWYKRGPCTRCTNIDRNICK